MKTKIYSAITLLILVAYCNNGNAQSANTSLSNLVSPTAVNVHLLPNKDNKRDLGSSGKSWKDIYLGGSVYIGGSRFLSANTGTGSGNTTVGADAFINNTTGHSNVAVGTSALRTNTMGFGMVAVGDSALFNQGVNSNGYYNNTAVGIKAMYSNTTGWENTAIGEYALYTNTTGALNTAIGGTSLYSNTTGSANTATGFWTLFYNSTGTGNTANGSAALFDNSTGSFNTAIGEDALSNNISGSTNTAVGFLAMNQHTTGYSNVAVGARSLIYSNESNLVAVGDSALYWNGFNVPAGSGVVAVGSKALFNNLSGSSNSAFGYQSLYANTSGMHNTALGYLAGNNITTGSDNTLIGYNANSGAAGTATNSTAIGSGASFTSSNNFVFGNSSVIGWGFATTPGTRAIKVGTSSSNGNGAYLTVGGTWTDVSARWKKEDFQKQDPQKILDKINQLEVTKWKYKGTEDEYHYGPMADDFHRLFNVGDDSATSDLDKTGVLFLGMQQLSEQNNELRKLNNAQQEQIDELRSIVLQLQQNLDQCAPCNHFADVGQASMSNGSSGVSGASLQQNIPNPFNHTTTINYTLPQQYSSAKIIVTDKSGKVLNEASLSNKGTGSLSIDASALSSGAYQYSLYVDGKLVATKQMVLTK